MKQDMPVDDGDIKRLLEWQKSLGGSFLPLEDPDHSEAKCEQDGSQGPGARHEKRSTIPEPGPIASGTPALETEVHAANPAVGTDLFGTPAPMPMQEMTPYERIKALIPGESPLHELMSLDAIADYVRATILIPLDEQRINAVPGVGNPDADLMLVGEAPGADEDKQGEPFVGRAGKLLTQILDAIDFKREDVFIGNILKSRPPNNRDPLPEEIEAHIPILYRQISLIKPKVILCLGRVAAQSLLATKKPLGKMRGEFQNFHGLEVLVTYHPAALLRNPHWKRPAWEDVQLIRKRYDELTST